MDHQSAALVSRAHKSNGDVDDEKALKVLHNRIQNGETHLLPLSKGLETLQGCFGVFAEFDEKALQYQKWYRRLALSSTLTGALAVFLALFQLPSVSPHNESHGVANVELIFAVLSLLLVLSVILTSMKQKWLLKRIQTERLRLGKFEAMLDRSFWNSSEHEHLKSKLTKEIGLMQLEGEDRIEEWAHNHPAPKVFSAPREVDRELAKEFRTYYLETRLETQLNYLKVKYPDERKHNVRTKHVGPLLFYASVIAVAGHFFLSYGANSPNLDWLTTFIGLAVGLPALAAFVRIHRDTREYGRNSLRHHATYNALSELSHQLKEEKTADGIFRVVGFCEQVLESDTREWMRLLSESEWFG